MARSKEKKSRGSKKRKSRHPERRKSRLRPTKTVGIVDTIRYTMVGRQKIIGNQEEIRFKVSMELCKHYNTRKGKLGCKSYQKIAHDLITLGVSPRYVGDLWRKHKEKILNTIMYDLRHCLAHKKGAGAPRRVSVADLHERVRAVPFNDRKNIRSLAKAVGIPRPTLGRAIKRGLLRTSKSHVRPMLTQQNKAVRVAYCKSHLDQENSFVPMLDRVDIDEKWFYLTQVNTKFILVPGEKPPHRVARHKSHIPKAMCLTAVARPRQDPATGDWWDGKIGTWFFVEQVPAKKNSKNRRAGTLVTETVNVNRENTCTMYIEKLLPAIMEKWPAWEERKVRIQFDNAPCHPKVGRFPAPLTDYLTSVRENDGWDIDFYCQPPNSPDCNTLDLAFFRAIQTIQYEKESRNLDELIANVEEAFDELPHDICRHVWSTAQIVMNSIILCEGGNDYKLPHVGKLKIARSIGRDFPTRIPCQAVIAGDDINEAAIVAFVAAEENSKLIVDFRFCPSLSSHLIDCRLY